MRSESNWQIPIVLGLDRYHAGPLKELNVLDAVEYNPVQGFFFSEVGQDLGRRISGLSLFDVKSDVV